MKKYLILLGLLFFIGIGIVKAELYYDNGDEKNIYDNRYLKEGDIIDFSKTGLGFFSHVKIQLYLDDELLTDQCFGTEEECLKQFVVTKNMVFMKSVSQGEVDSVHMYHYNFVGVKDGNEVIKYNIPLPTDDYPLTKEEQYYKSGDIIIFSTEDNEQRAFGFYIYDLAGKLIRNGVFRAPSSTVYVLPQINGKDVYWYNTVFIDGGYGYPLPHFTPFEYQGPIFELSCDEDTLNYGDKTTCKLMVLTNYEMTDLSFAFKKADLKISNVKYVDGISNTSNDGHYELVINKNAIVVGKKSPIMTFNVEGINDDNYLDIVQLENIVYVDELINAEYKDLNSDMKIKSIVNDKLLEEVSGEKELEVSKDIKNPNTESRRFLLLMPVIILAFVLLILFINKKRMNKYSN